MAENRQKTGAVHMTELDIDISKAIENLEELRRKVEETSEYFQKMPPFEYGGGGKSGGGGTGTNTPFKSSISAIETLNLQYKNFLNTLEKSKLSDSKIGEIKKQAQESAQAISDLTQTVKGQERVTKDNAKQYQDLSSKLKALKGDLKDAETQAIHTGQGFKQGEPFVTRFINALSDKVKWYAAFQAINLVQAAFGNVISTIKDTEDAVIEIQRVLNDPSLADSTVSQRIYDIAYDYGQTFENVQEVFTRFAQAGLDFEQATKATEAAMLGLNTAELDVSTATQGLIAIMAQFGYTADDLTSIIDKINITADNFAVTSEKIVAGLQRAGGTAHAFGLTLEETIGIITALSEATGRSGEQIGTALNSLISFTEKASSLSKFSDYLGVDASQMGVLDLWRSLSAAIKDGDNSLAQMLSTSEEFNDLFTEEIASAIGATEEFNKAQMEAKDVYGTVGTYRQNYFIALLNNIDTAIEAIDQMGEAEGYSLSENEKAMSRLTAQWNQLVVAAQELAVQFGEAGFLDILKWVSNFSTGVLKLTKDFGGLRTALIGLVGLLITVKSTKITEMLSDWKKGFSGLGSAFTALKAKILSYKASVDAATTSQEMNTLAMQGAVAGIGLLTIAISGIIGLYSAWKQAADERAEAAYEEAKATSNQAKEVADLIVSYRQSEKAYAEGKTSKDNLNAATEALVKKLKDEGIIVEELSGDYEELKGKIDGVLESVSDEQLAAAGRAADDAADRFVKAFNESLSGGVVIPVQLGDVSQFGQDIDTQLMGLLRDIDGLTTKSTLGFLGQGMTYSLALESQIKTIDDAVNAYNTLLEAKKAVVDYYGPEIAGTTEIYKQIDNQIVSIKGAYEEYEGFKNQLKEIEDAYNGVIPAIEESNDTFDGQSVHIIDLEEELKTLADEYDRVEGKLSSIQSAYGTLISAVDEYNDTGIMTSEMLEKLLQLEPEYISLLEAKNGQLSLNKDGVDALVNSTDTYMQQMVALKIAEEAEALATELQAAATNNYTLEQFKAQAATAAFSSELYTAVLNMIQGTGTAEELAHALGDVAASAQLSGEWLEYFNGQFQSIFSGYAQLLSLPISFKLPSSSYKPSSGSGSGSKSSDGAKAAKEALQAEIKAYQEREKEAKEYYGDLEDQIKESRNAEIDALKDELSAQKEYYSNLKKETQKYYDSLIDSLKDVQKENDRINAQMDYYQNRQKILTNIEQAQSRSGVEWREKEMEYQQQLIALDEDWRRKQEDWAIEDQIAALEQQKEAAIQSIEETIAAVEKGIEAQIKSLEDLRDAEIKNIDEILKETTKEFEDIIKGLQDQVSKLSSYTSSSMSGGISSGIIEGSTAFSAAVEDMKSKWKDMVSTSQEAIEKTKEASREIYQTEHELLDLTSMREALLEEFPAAAAWSAEKVYRVWQEKFLNPTKKSIEEMFRDAMAKAQSLNQFTSGAATLAKILGNAYSAGNTSNNINMTNYISNTASANTIANRFTNFSTRV